MESVLCFCSKHACGKTPHQASVSPAICLATEHTEKGEGWCGGVPFLNKFKFFSSKRSRCPAPLMTSDPDRRSYWSGWRGLLKLTIEEGLGKWPDGGEGWLNGVTAQKDGGVQEGEGCLVGVCVCVSRSEELSFWAAPSSRSSCPQVCPRSYCDSELQQDRRPQTNRP